MRFKYLIEIYINIILIYILSLISSSEVAVNLQFIIRNTFSYLFFYKAKTWYRIIELNKVLVAIHSFLKFIVVPYF